MSPKTSRLSAVALTCSALLLPGTALAATYTVTSDADSGAASLRDAVAQANANPGSDLIVFDSGVTSISLSAPAIEITDSVTINDGMPINIAGPGGNSAQFITKDSAPSVSRIFTISSGTVTLNNMFLSDGDAGTENGGALLIAAAADVTLNDVTLALNQSGGAAAGQGGGAIFNQGQLTMNNCLVTENTVTGAAGNGGGIFNASGAQLTMNDGSVTFNIANRAGGGIENNGGSVTLNDVSVRDNTVNTAPGNGGGLHSQPGEVTVNGGAFNRNTAGNEGGGLWNGNAGTMNLRGVTVADNTVSGGIAGDTTRGGGGVFNLGVMSIGQQTVVENNVANGVTGNGGGIMNAGTAATLTIENSRIDGNQANRAGGGIENQGGGKISIRNSQLTNNNVGVSPANANPGNGGGLHAAGGGSDVTISFSQVENNRAASEGGGLWSASSLSVFDTEISNNVASGDSAEEGGGGIFNQAGITSVVFSSISGNVADGASGSGGGLFNNAGEMTLSSVTISGNQANRAGGGIESKNATGDGLTMNDLTMRDNNTGVAPAVAAPGNGGALHVTGSGVTTVTRGLYINNRAAREGGALWNGGSGANMTVNNAFFRANVALGEAAHDGGGAIFNNGGQLDVVDSGFFDNLAVQGSGSGGAILNLTGDVVVNGGEFRFNKSARAGGAFEDNSNGDGGAVMPRTTTVSIAEVSMEDNVTGPTPGNGGALHITGNGNVTVDSSSIIFNSADNEGGGLWNFNSGELTVVNSTVSGNESPTGGGLFTQAGSGKLTVVNTTVANNNAALGGGLAANSGAVVDIDNSIIGDNTADDANDVSGVVSVDYSLIEDDTGAVLNGENNIVGEDPQLSSLEFNGNGNQSHAIASTSPAFDAADTTVCQFAPVNDVDQRAVSRDTLGLNCDMGAYELAQEIRAAAISATDAGQINPVAGDDNVVILAVNFTNTTNQTLFFDGFRGRVESNGRFDLSQLSNFAIFNDDNGNGQVDVGDNQINADIIYNAEERGFFIEFDGGRGQRIDVGETNTYLVTASIGSSPFLAWLGLPFLLMLGAALARRAKALVSTAGMAVLALFMAGCNDGTSSGDQVSGNGNNLPDFFFAEDGDAEARFIITGFSVTAEDGITSVLVDGLPINGPEIEIKD